MAVEFLWKPDTFAGFICEMPDNISLIASPRRTVSRGLKLRAANKTDWQAQCSVWDQSTRTLSRFGRDAWRDHPANADEAKRLAESIYLEAVSA